MSAAAITGPTVGERIKRLRTVLGWDQRQLAKAAGVGQATVSDAESGKRAPQTAKLQAIARAFGVTTGELLGEVAKVPAVSMPAGEPAHGAVMLLQSDLHPSPLNPRKIYQRMSADEIAADEALNDLGLDIGRHGVLQNLTARPSPSQPGKYEIAIGERRWHASGIAIQRGLQPADFRVPVVVRGLTDLELLEIALAENVRRQDMHPLEEGEAFARVAEMSGERDAATTGLGDRYGKSQRWVQLRIALALKLDPTVKAAFLAGRVYLEQARMLVLGPHDRQRAVLKMAAKGEPLSLSPPQIRTHMLGDLPPVGRNVFPLERYTGEFRAPDETGLPHAVFIDVEQFAQLQEAGIEDHRVRLAGEWAWVEITRGFSFNRFSFTDSDDRTLAGAMILVKPTHEVEIHTGLLRPKDQRKAQQASGAARPERDTGVAKPEGGGAKRMPTKPAQAEAEPPGFLKAHLAAARRHKTEALQDRIAASEEAALQLMCMALLGCTGAVHVAAVAHGPEDRAIGPKTAETLAHFAQLLGLRRPRSDEDLTLLGLAEMRTAEAEAKLWAKLGELKPKKLGELFAALVAARCGSFNDAGAIELGDPPAALAIARTFGLKGADEVRLKGGWLEQYRKPALLELAADSGAIGAADLADFAKTGADPLRRAVLSSTTRRKAHIPRELRFGTQAELEAQALDVAQLMKPPELPLDAPQPRKAKADAKAKPAAKKKPKAKAARPKRRGK